MEKGGGFLRRICSVFLCVLLLAPFILPANAATEATRVDLQAIVYGDGTCQVALTATIHVEQGHDALYFPVPLNASSVMLAGSRASLTESGSVLLIELDDYIGPALGDIPLSISYTLSDVAVRDGNDQPQLQLPLLSGFSYPIKNFSFSVTMPGQVSAKPTFVSGYHQANIEKDLVFNVDGAMVRGSAVTELKDHESLTMGLVVPEGMFDLSAPAAPSLTVCYWAIGVLAVLALSYWLLKLRCSKVKKTTAASAPDGYTAGELACLLNQQGANLTMMVFTWGQLGYVLIQVDRHGRVLLHKRMEMGNERSAFECRCFQMLFAKRTVVDTTSLAYARLRQKVDAHQPDMHSFVDPKCGSINIFRALGAGMAMFFGVCIGINLSSGAVLQWLLAFLLGGCGLFSGWYLQGYAYCLRIPNPYRRRNTWIHVAVWLALGFLAGQLALAAVACLVQYIVGLMAAFGGRRTQEGKRMMSQILGLRRYMKKLSQSQLQQIHETNLEFFHAMAPYAMTLGVDQQFARRYGAIQLPTCSYLTTGMDGHMTAPEWNRLMRRTADSMDGRFRQLRTEMLLGMLQGLRKK